MQARELQILQIRDEGESEERMAVTKKWAFTEAPNAPRI
jgi:hypothetical protein